MFCCEYLVNRIEGDYAVLTYLEGDTTEEKLVARALLPEEIKEGSRLLYKFLSYTLVEEK